MSTDWLRELRERGQRMPGVDRIWLPGEQSHLRRIDTSESTVFLLAPSLVKQLNDLASQLQGHCPLSAPYKSKPKEIVM